MTINEFLALLDPDDGWELSDEGYLCDGNEYCPVWNVYWSHFADNEPDDMEPAEHYGEAAERFGLRARDALAIANASDNKGHARLRRRILARLGLVDPGPAEPTT